MISAKCIRVDTKKHKYLLKDGNGDERWVTKTQLKNVIGRTIDIINLNKDTLEFSLISGFENYHKLSSDAISEKSKQVDIKSAIIGVRPDTHITHDIQSGEVVEICLHGTYDSLYITDCIRRISGDIRANTITFIGEQRLIWYDNLSKITCRKAIIYNKSIIDSFSDNIFQGKISINALEVELKHDYIDANTIFEMYYMLNESKVRNTKSSLLNRLHLIVVHFERLDIDEKLLLRNIKIMSKSMQGTKKGMFADIEDQFKDYKINIEGFSKFNDTSAGKQVYKYLNSWCTYLAFLVSLHKSLPQFKSWLITEGDATVEVMYKIVRSYQWDYVHKTEWLSKCHNLCNEAVDYYKSSIGDNNGK